MTAQVLTTLAAGLAIFGGLWRVVDAINRHVTTVKELTKAVSELAQRVETLDDRIDVLEGERVRAHPEHA